MVSSEYTVEFEGSHYVVVKSGHIVAAFVSAEEAYEAKRSFVGKPVIEDWQKIPPSIRFAKSQFVVSPAV
ncbi:MAG: hypothetical protein R3189_06215 [Thiomicrorhabdus chilensis]|uniref:hypothetical protein n=1 Tax=Thiomicrorhabdus chilensis TaxID=63656 RepID=UPI00299DCDAD|nr:hypothetical protein [Thiomicrorhabdus chilensis]MDX1347825.1 hypothetical protein [Thiomicrorhabdus chilensis]